MQPYLVWSVVDEIEVSASTHRSSGQSSVCKWVADMVLVIQ